MLLTRNANWHPRRDGPTRIFDSTKNFFRQNPLETMKAVQESVMICVCLAKKHQGMDKMAQLKHLRLIEK